MCLKNEGSGADVRQAPGADFDAFQATNAARIDAVVQRLGARRFTSLHWDLVDELKGVLGAQAANASSDDAGEQEDAIAEAEGWVTDNVSQGGVESTVAMALWLRGLDAGPLLFGVTDVAATTC